MVKSKTGIFALVAALLPLAVLADSLKPACMPPETGPNGRVTLLCMAEMPESLSQCQDYVDELASIESRTLEQTLALAFGQAFASPFDDDVDAFAKAELAGRELLRPLVEGAPNDAMLLYAYSSFYVGDDVLGAVASPFGIGRKRRTWRRWREAPPDVAATSRSGTGAPPHGVVLRRLLSRAAPGRRPWRRGGRSPSCVGPGSPQRRDRAVPLGRDGKCRAASA